MSKKANSPTLSASIDVHVPFHDADPAGYVWHGRYFKYFEAARRALLERIGYSHAQMVESGFIWPIVDTRVRYTRALRYDQHIKVIATLKEWELRLVIDYCIEDHRGRISTRGSTTQVPVEIESGELWLGSVETLHDCVNAALGSPGVSA